MVVYKLMSGQEHILAKAKMFREASTLKKRLRLERRHQSKSNSNSSKKISNYVNLNYMDSANPATDSVSFFRERIILFSLATVPSIVFYPHGRTRPCAPFAVLPLRRRLPFLPYIASAPASGDLLHNRSSLPSWPHCLSIRYCSRYTATA